MSPRAPKHCGRNGCLALVRGRTYCDEHQPVAWDGGYGSTRQWRKLRAVVLTEEPVCRDCRINPSTEAGHIIPRAYGGTDERRNLKGQCHPCNVAQIQTDRRSLQ